MGRESPRFTPTCVGTTLLFLCPSLCPPVHPHVRGDNLGWQQKLSCIAGSPPRAWGQQVSNEPVYFDFRFTPTCVGTTSTNESPEILHLVHPHVRGDNIEEQMAEVVEYGSPQRAWGQLIFRNNTDLFYRFTPTCVGTTRTGSWPQRILAVHPHVRGDNDILESIENRINGSPPRAWGQQFLLPVPLKTLRFTPTCVGTTAASQSSRCCCAVHPHVRGDNR